MSRQLAEREAEEDEEVENAEVEEEEAVDLCLERMLLFTITRKPIKLTMFVRSNLAPPGK